MSTNSILLTSAIFMMATSVTAFSPAINTRRPMSSLPYSSTTMDNSETPYFADLGVENEIPQQKQMTVPKSTPKPAKTLKKPKTKGAQHKRGLLSPVVLLTKKVLGEDNLKTVRAKAISLHSEVIGDFVQTSQTETGNRVLRQLFHIADKNKNGTIDEEELAVALNSLGFDWLKDKQVKGIFSRADKDDNGAIDLDEWMNEAPKTLRTNLIKLAKKNGGDLGLLV